MFKFLNNLPIGLRMVLSVSLLAVTLAAALYSAYATVSSNIEFAVKEKMGNEYQRPLAGLMRGAGTLRLLLTQARGGRDAAADIKAVSASIDEGMQALATAQEQVGAALQFTGDGLGSRGRGHLKYETVLAKWRKLSDDMAADPAGDLDGSAVSFIADLRGMIAHSGDTSNLVLDPDLDSYYLMDVTLIALPQTADRLAAIAAAIYPWTAADYVPDAAGVVETAVLARMLKESDVDRIAADVDTSLKEDVNFYGESPGYKNAITPAFEEYRAKNAALADMLGKIASGAAVDQAAFLAAWHEAEESAVSLWQTGLVQLDALLDIRIAAYRDKQRIVLAITAAAFLSMFFFIFVARGITGPLADLSSAMSRLVASELGTEVPYAAARSEIGMMARSVQSFKDAAIASERLEAEKQAELRRREERQSRIEELIHGFEAMASGIVSSVASAATELYQTAERMTQLVSGTSGKATDISGSARQTSANVESVAAAAEEMTASVREISSQITKSTAIVAETVRKSQETGSSGKALETATLEINGIIELIETLAGQINLLALNATIESARAGEAGKGFAVVASEVKNLASQTAEATDGIRKKVASVQDVAKAVLASIDGIVASVGNINESSSVISAAVEEQSAVTSEIAVNMATAASGVRNIDNDIQQVSSSARQASESSGQVLDAAKMLSRQAETLSAEIEKFLREIRAA